MFANVPKIAFSTRQWQAACCKRPGKFTPLESSYNYSDTFMHVRKVYGKRILLVDDQREVREAIKLLLAEDGHSVVEANNGAEALNLFARGKFDLVITDFRMPFITGDELASQIKQIDPWQPILMLTAYAERPCRTNPVDVVLCKPVDFDQLRDQIAKLAPEWEETQIIHAPAQHS